MVWLARIPPGCETSQHVPALTHRTRLDRHLGSGHLRVCRTGEIAERINARTPEGVSHA